MRWKTRPQHDLRATKAPRRTEDCASVKDMK